MNIKEELKNIIAQSLKENNIDWPTPKIMLDIPSDKQNGDYATNIALVLKNILNQNPLDIAQKILSSIHSDIIAKIEIKNPGFINIFINKQYLWHGLANIFHEQGDYGRSNIGQNKKINIEFVSANPTGILHLGHARGASYGDNLSNILSFAGYNVTREYYINDAGNQINNLADSIRERYKELCHLPFEIGANGYLGHEIIDIAQDLYDKYQETLLDQNESIFKTYGLKVLLDQIKNDLEAYRVKFDIWSSEQKLYDNHEVEKAINQLKISGKTYESENALFLKTTSDGDDKDRVLIKSDGTYTYFAPDIAYHLNKLNRGYDTLIDVLGADHHGYIARLKSAIKSLGFDGDQLEVKIIQMVRLMKNQEELKMSKRTGNAITINELVSEVGLNATRYFFASRSIENPMDFDMDLAIKKSSDNPVYYIEYAHARICSILNDAKRLGLENIDKYDTITSEYAYNVLTKLYEFPNIVESSALKQAPNIIANYAYDLASLFHLYYSKERILTDNKAETVTRLALITGIKIVLCNALNLIGIIPREKM